MITGSYPLLLLHGVLNHVGLVSFLGTLVCPLTPVFCEQVQDLIHPSLYPYVRGISYEPGAKDTDVPRPKKSLRQPKKDSEEEEEEKEEEEEENEGDDSLLDLGGDPETEREFELKEKELREDEDTSDYQWLPAEFFVNAEGQVSIESYINNLDRKQHPELYENIAAIFGHFLPLFEGVRRAFAPTLSLRTL